jgi:hypothetical protein
MERNRKNKFTKLFIGLVVVVIVLTFFSKSFYNYRLPVVTVTLPKQGNLSFTVEGEAELTYSDINSVYANVDGRIQKILVTKGETVEVDQCLMQIAVSGSEDVYDVVATKSGVITSVGVEEGMYVSSMQNTVLYEIAMLSDEWNCTLVISEEQLEYVDTGNKATIEFTDTKEKIEGEIQSVVAYAGQNTTGYQVNILVRSEDDSLAGKRVNIVIEKDSIQYDTLIPTAALCKDAVGYYVLVLQQSDSVLGNGYEAKRMSVDLLDSDDTYCAVRGLPTDESVIIASTGNITDGSDVYYEGDEVQ